MTAFSSWQRLNPKTKLGRPPPDGKPGFNPDLMLLDLEKLRSSAKFKAYLDERKLNSLVSILFNSNLAETFSDKFLSVHKKASS
jgi:hypothetical protein